MGEHQRRNGYSRPAAVVETVTVRVTGRDPAPMALDELPPPMGTPRRAAEGPAVLAEPDCTVWLPAGWTAAVGGGGSWILRRSRS